MKEKILPKSKSVAGGQLANSSKKRRKLILSDASPSSEEKAGTKQPIVKTSSKPAKAKSHRGERTKANTLEKGKAKEPL